MKIMFVGLGLIGGSMAMALEGYPDLERYAVDGDEPTRLEALGRGVVRAADCCELRRIFSEKRDNPERIIYNGKVRNMVSVLIVKWI